MPRILYRATDPSGNPVEDFIEADGARAALDVLRARGLSDIRLQDDVVSAAACHETARVGADSREIARIALAMRRGAGLGAVWRQVARGARWWLAFAVLMLVWGLVTRNAFFSILGAAMLVLPFVISGLSYRHAARYEAYLRAAAFGRRTEMARLGDLLGQAIKDPAMRFDLAVRDAEFTAREQGLPAALEQVAPYREAMDQRAPSVFPARVALVHLAGGDTAGFVQRMREAFDVSDHDAGRALDAALAEARCGDPRQARVLLAGIDPAVLSPMALIFRDWVDGLLDEQEGRDGRAGLSLAVEGFTRHARMPAVWSALAASTCDYALALARHGDPAHGRALVETVWPVARIHLDAPTRERIEHTFFAGVAPAAPER